MGQSLSCPWGTGQAWDTTPPGLQGSHPGGSRVDGTAALASSLGKETELQSWVVGAWGAM